MKTINKLLMILALVIWVPKLNAQETSEQLVVPLSKPGQPFTLKVNIVEGSIKVASYEGKEIVIDVVTPNNKSGKKEFSVAENGMKRITSSGSFEITAHEDNNNVSVNTGNPNKRFDLSLKIPQDVKLKLSTVNDGNIDVDNVRGELEITNVNGDIKLNNISGSVVSNTVNGDITTTFVKVDPQAPMAFSTLNGNINVTFPADFKANLKLKSDHGEIFTDFDIDIDKSYAKTQKTNESGVYKVKLEDWVYGKINGGGPEIMMKNMHSNIYVKKAGK